MSETTQQNPCVSQAEPEVTQSNATETQPQAAEAPVNRGPDYNAFSVKDGDNGQSYFTKVGVGFNHRDNNGITVEAEAWPINNRLVLRTPRERLEQLRSDEPQQAEAEKDQGHGE